MNSKNIERNLKLTSIIFNPLVYKDFGLIKILFRKSRAKFPFLEQN
jgi:hypothetical protein